MTGPIDTAPCGFLVVDDGATVLDANRTLADALGTTPEAMRGRPVRELLAAGSRLYYQTHFFPLLRLRGEVHEVYLSLKTAAGEDLPVLLNATRREDGEGPVSTIAVVPIERRSRFEDEILEARRTAETASESRARLLSMLSHDVRSPLTAMTYAADFMRQGMFGAVTEPQTAQLEQIATAGRYVLRLVSDVLDFSRLENGRVDVRPQPVPVDQAVGAVCALLAAEAEATGVALAPPSGPEVSAWADPDRLQQILANLVGNAVKFTGDGGRVAVTWEGNDGGVAIQDRDTGPGIAPERLAAIFAPFIQEDGPGASGGVGLGLAISRELAQAMGGGLDVESVLGEGAVFTVTLPPPPDSTG